MAINELNVNINKTPLDAGGRTSWRRSSATLVKYAGRTYLIPDLANNREVCKRKREAFAQQWDQKQAILKKKTKQIALKKLGIMYLSISL